MKSRPGEERRGAKYELSTVLTPRTSAPSRLPIFARGRLEPKIKEGSEEYGKKRQLRALLSSLDKVLWEGSGWKSINLGDVLDGKKARRAYLKASLKVHPDKTKDLNPEQKFIATRVFDALSQANSEFEAKGGM